ncbi:SAM hydrolase/SAM-dependent halogenase family protein [Bythopirellula goksoeyrii]|uniref:Adenosyl-chloride synthase n=1 Tax=Bythopirellula goksoeyrii TaxID=1400387 RepID=A0A5B9Q9X1_9BACT|nr:SAM-dependent chlorinase/fluorinase [Bythopirellula goksoeyrii]QEG35678.1 Adenosyl-chloride synthase [Bythopirellula goksoeyrii]
MIITLTTDFGASSPYVAALKGVILSINPQVQLVDISHTIPPQQIRLAAQVLANTTPLFPAGTIHVAVVDPGVGTSRDILYAEFGDQRYVCPDNGLLDRLADRHLPTKIICVNEAQYFRPQVAPTFHGRDIMAPVAGHLSLGLAPDLLGPRHETLVNLQWQEAEKMANRIEGEVVEVDSFGNLITNITRDMLADVPTDETVAIRCDDHETRSIFQTYGDQPAMTLVALIGSNDNLEIAIVDESATIMLGVGVGAPVEVSW